MDRFVDWKRDQKMEIKSVIPGGNAIWSGDEIVNEKVIVKVKLFLENARI